MLIKGETGEGKANPKIDATDCGTLLGVKRVFRDNWEEWIL